MSGALDWQLAGKPVIVTGASSGIGAATAAALGAAEASVVLVGRDEKRLQQSRKTVEETGGKAHIVQAELTDIAAAEGVVSEAVAAFGDLYGIVHSASVFDPQPLEATTPESAQEQWLANVAAPLFMTKAAVPHMQAESAVVFIASTTGSVGFPGCSAYSATKGAVIALGRALAVELAPKGIRVNTVVPGYVRTPMLQPHLDNIEGYEDWILSQTPQARIAGPEELATNIVFMLSGLSRYVHGATLVVDGGWVAR